MSHFLDRLMFLTEHREPFAGGHGETRKEDRKWEDAYRLRWQHDKIVRSTHGVNCTGGCSWRPSRPVCRRNKTASSAEAPTSFIARMASGNAQISFDLR